MGRRIPVGCKRISPDTNASLGAMCSIASTSSSGDLTRKSCSIPEGVWKPCRWPECRAMQQGSTEQCLAADCLQPTLLRRFGFRQQLKASVAMTSNVKGREQLFLGLHHCFHLCA